MTEVQLFLSDVTVGNSIIYRSLTMFPLLSKKDGTLEYRTLDEALRGGHVRVGETSRAGSVPELRFENSGELPVLIVDGEELVGAKQNRTANLTVLVPARTTIVLPVSCVEAGRWSDRSGGVVASDRAHFARGRASRVASVSCAMESSGSRRSDQARVWRDIDRVACCLEAPSPTRAMGAVFERHHGPIEDHVGALAAIEDQVGALFAIGSEVVGFDLFDRRSTLAALLPKLVRSYAVGALELEDSAKSLPDEERAKAFFEEAGSAKASTYPAVGLGTDIRLSAHRIAGGGLVVEGSLLHLAVFAVEDELSGEGSEFRGMASARTRRRSAQRR